jgi:hypothetical protein
VRETLIWRSAHTAASAVAGNVSTKKTFFATAQSRNTSEIRRTSTNTSPSDSGKSATDMAPGAPNDGLEYHVLCSIRPLKIVLYHTESGCGENGTSHTAAGRSRTTAATTRAARAAIRYGAALVHSPRGAGCCLVFLSVTDSPMKGRTIPHGPFCDRLRLRTAMRHLKGGGPREAAASG